ncbi:constitutive coactivator of peroxisome proliferator-activated receptor gamma-like [Macrosteles quadrilineatus]|uniref:constitutive coactivator of peroxisome proliferator-activated receptor gamma-like n=1 Tax=Macrosteles quadrilineatus TaxID=74068 RepID=UPI0023E1C9BF|nr:constitutive coactivator of peroxisome proliferator-activated receptor gamma-like [Macrosteles quadrilineatus]XP_054273477.1 constitutive coactivator of peroxisome proliferator-activated receptor gamma-like [Macrosteles quadrilineatus]XP_054273478.1 constitutive coactivator of peroxisome proliferator-activated receptor gamma-like [Macrosteles quadrilineatus]XP_054273479.1 constitutive coactivator of peroxisome proliferator-activated receptor gamma-like [Macrosteles quadrilineatus]
MGIRGLQFYLEKCCQPASQRVSIEDMVQEYRNWYQLPFDQELVIVVDGNSCIRHLYGDLEWIGGGQLKQYGEKAQFFVNQFARLGVRLVFFFDGPTVEQKRKTWIERRLSKLGSMYHVLDAIEEGVPSSQIDRRAHFHLPPGMGQLSRVIFETICGCEVFISLNECDEEIAHYARTKNAFAILGQDTDFVVLDKREAWYLSMEKLRLDDMTTLLYDHKALAHYLKIHVTQLPVLATLMGNDIIDHKDIKAFHIRMLHQRFPSERIDFKVLVPNLAMYIRKLPIGRDRLYNKTYELSTHLFGTPDNAEQVWTSIQSYDAVLTSESDIHSGPYKGHWGRVLAVARRRHKRNEAPSMVYAIMCGLPFESSTSIEDFRKTDLPCFAKATAVIRRRIYGILLQEKPLDPGQTCHVVPEWCMAGPGSLDEPHYAKAIPPKYPHPGLLALWAKNRQDLGAVRWQLFVSSVCPDLDIHKIRRLPTHLLIPTLVLAFLEEFGCLEDWEVAAVLATAVCLPQYNVQRLAALPGDPMTTRGIRVANLLMRSTFVIYFLLATCGYPETIEHTAPWLFFDGKLFHLKYNQAMNACPFPVLYNHRNDNRKYFVQAQDIIYKR